MAGKSAPLLSPLRTGLTIDKPTFGSAELGKQLLELDAKEPVGEHHARRPVHGYMRHLKRDDRKGFSCRRYR